MKSLFNSSDNQEIIARLNTLTNVSQGLWGKMNVAQMLAHCQEPLLVAFGEKELKRGFIALLFGGFMKNQLTRGEKPFSKNLPTDKTFIVVDSREFEIEKRKLITLVNRFFVSGNQGITKKDHPFFGKMTPQEWDTIQWKHLDHHLRQFGV